MSRRVDTTVSSEHARRESRPSYPSAARVIGKERVFYVMTRIGRGWSVRKEGTDRPVGTFNTKIEAIKRAREVARSGGGEVVIFDEYARVQKVTTYPARRASAKAKRQ